MTGPPTTTPDPPSSQDPLALRRATLLGLGTRIARANDEDEIRRAVVEGLHVGAPGHDFMALLLVDPGTGERVLKASVGWADAPPGLRIRPDRGLSERPLLDGQLHYTPPVTADTRYLPTRNVGSEVDLPLKIGDERAGVLVVESDRVDAFGPADFEILPAAANQARRFRRMMGGDVELESESGEGTSFTVRLPRPAPDGDEPAPGDG